MISAITDDRSSAKLLRSVALARLPGAAAVAIALPRVKAEPSSTWLGGGVHCWRLPPYTGHYVVRRSHFEPRVLH